MSDEFSKHNPAYEPETDKTTEQSGLSQSAEQEVWVMPKPVFKQTSGYSPLLIEHDFTGNEDITIRHPKITIPTPQDNIGSAAIEPQPDVDDVEPESIISNEPSPPKKNEVFSRILMILLALIIVGLMVAILVAVIWFVFWPRPDATIN